MNRRSLCVLLLVILTPPIVQNRVAIAQDSDGAADEPLELPDRQDLIGRRFKEFEAVLQRTAELLRRSDPDRAALLLKAFSKSKKDLVTVQLQELVEDLRSGELQTAVKEQEQILGDLTELLDLLLSEDRGRRLRELRERLEKRLGQVRKLSRRQKALRTATERMGPENSPEKSRNLAEQQGELSEDTKGLIDRIAEGQGVPANDRPPPVVPEQPEGGKERQSETQRLQAARQAMQRAKERLEQQKREQAARSQDEAVRELQDAIAELEELLRQLREEEQLVALASLEARLRKVLEMQQAVRQQTVELDLVPERSRTRADRQKALALSRQEEEIIGRVDQALFVLREDGEAIAFPESLRQVKGDAELIASLLAKGATGKFTQSVEDDVIQTLQEMVASLQRQIREARQRSGQPGGGPQQSSPLIDRLAELKMIRSLQYRVNRRTERIAELAGGKMSEEIAKSIADLAERQARIYRITREIALEEGK